MPSWNDVGRKPPPEPQQVDELDEVCAAALSSPAGRRLMEVLHRRYIEGVMPGQPDERALLFQHAQRHLVRQLENATKRGLAAIARRTEKTDVADAPSSAPVRPRRSTRSRR